MAHSPDEEGSMCHCVPECTHYIHTGKRGPEEKTVACVSLRDQWVSLPLHSASRAPAAGSYLTHPTSSPEQSSKPGAFSIRSPFLKLLIPASQKAGDRPVLSTISISSVSLESWNLREVQKSLESVRQWGAEISGVSERMRCKNLGDH